MLTRSAMAQIDPCRLLHSPYRFDLAFVPLPGARTPPSLLARLHDGIMTAVDFLPHLMIPGA